MKIQNIATLSQAPFLGNQNDTQIFTLEDLKKVIRSQEVKVLLTLDANAMGYHLAFKAGESLIRVSAPDGNTSLLGYNGEIIHQNNSIRFDDAEVTEWAFKNIQNIFGMNPANLVQPWGHLFPERHLGIDVAAFKKAVDPNFFLDERMTHQGKILETKWILREVIQTYSTQTRRTYSCLGNPQRHDMGNHGEIGLIFSPIQ